MTALARTDLTPAQKTQLAATALGLQVPVATVAELARQFDISRPTVYAAKDVAARVLGTHFAYPLHEPRLPSVTGRAHSGGHAGPVGMGEASGGVEGERPELAVVREGAAVLGEWAALLGRPVAAGGAPGRDAQRDSAWGGCCGAWRRRLRPSSPSPCALWRRWPRCRWCRSPSSAVRCGSW